MRHEVVWSTVPLAVYRELAAHLRQVPGVQADLLPQTAAGFDYDRSQVGGLWYELPDGAVTGGSPSAQSRVEQILTYYRDRHLV
jgi:outer membrane protein TolC